MPDNFLLLFQPSVRALTVIGSAIAAIEYWPQGRWMCGLYCSALAGAAYGYLAILKVYREPFV